MVLDLFKYSLLIIYLLFVTSLAAAILFSRTVRFIFYRIHSSKTDKYSWMRYVSSVILIFTIGVVSYQTTFSQIDVPAVTLLAGIAIGGKVTQSGINKDK